MLASFWLYRSYTVSGFLLLGNLAKLKYSLSYEVHNGFQQFIPADRQHGLDVTFSVCVYHIFLSILKKVGHVGRREKNGGFPLNTGEHI